MRPFLDWKTIWSKQDKVSSRSISESIYKDYKVIRKKGRQLTKYKNYKNWEDYYINGVNNRYYSTEYALMAAIDDLINDKEVAINERV